MRFQWIKIAIAAVVAEILAILMLVGIVAIFGPHEANADQAYAEKLGRWVGPIAGAFLGFVGALWIARPLKQDRVLHGALFGLLLAAIDVVLLVAMRAPFEWLLVVSNFSKLVAGTAGGAFAFYLNGHPSRTAIDTHITKR